MKLTRKTILTLVAAGLLIALAVLAWANDLITTQSDSYLITRHKQGMGTLTETVDASQTFTAPQNGLSSVSVMVSNFNKNGKIKSGMLNLWLTAEDGTELARTSVECAPLRNNASVTLPLETVQNTSAGKRYILHATSDCTDQQGVTLRIGPAEGTGDTGLILADGSADPENCLYLGMTFVTRTHGWMGTISLLLMAACLLCSLPFARGKENRDD